MRKRGQSSVEFTFLISFMFLVFVVFFYVAGSRFASIKGDNEKLLLEDFGDYLKAEISLAASAADGYQRIFEIPSQLGGRDYNVSIIPNGTGHPFSEMAVSYYSSSIDYTYVLNLPLQTSGGVDPTSGSVIIQKRDNQIFICSETCLNNEGGTCDDGRYCTTNDKCQGCICTGTPTTCTDSDLCTIDSCDEDSNDCTYTSKDCSDDLFCTEYEMCNPVTGLCTNTMKDCSANNLTEIKKCNNNPDNNPFTWDHAAGFTSVCDEATNSCTASTYTFTHTCDKTRCGAECKLPSDCVAGHACNTTSCSCVCLTSPPKAEICDGLDNDCDGSVDEGIPCILCNYWCYQENPKITTGCGGLSTGNYYMYPFNWDSPSTDAYDGDWNTYAEALDNSANFYVNYSKPVWALNSSKWQVKNNSMFATNYTIPESCWSQSPLQLRVKYMGSNLMLYYCYNGTTWTVLNSNRGDELYEEAMWWNISRDKEIYYFDKDKDGFGNATVEEENCYPPIDYVLNNADCNDNNATIHPGAAEICDGKDNDCNTLIDEGIPCMPCKYGCYQETATTATSCGGLSTGRYTTGGEPFPKNSSTRDGNWNTYAGISSLEMGYSYLYIDYTKPSNAFNSSKWMVKDIVSTVNLSLPMGCWNQGKLMLRVSSMRTSSTEGYMYSTTWSCNNGTSWVSLRSNSQLYNFNYSRIYEEAMWWNISGDYKTFYLDSEGDGFGNATNHIEACLAPVGYVLDNSDCNDNNANIHPGATEICDGIDNDCDASSADGSEDTQLGAACDGTDSDLCKEGNYYCASGSLACSDTNENTYELCDGLDNDCDGSIDDNAFCPGGTTCVDGYCTCNDECSPSGTKVCANTNTYQECGNWDPDPCLDWQYIVCPKGYTCVNGNCRIVIIPDPVCNPPCTEPYPICNINGECCNLMGYCLANS